MILGRFVRHLVFGATVFVGALGLGACTASQFNPSGSSQSHAPSFWTPTAAGMHSPNSDVILAFMGDAITIDVPCGNKSWAFSPTTRSFSNVYSSVTCMGADGASALSEFERLMPTV